LCPQTIQPNRPQQLPEEQEQHGSGIADQSATIKQKNKKNIFRKIQNNNQKDGSQYSRGN
jgi:hypothetical protein